MEIRKIYARSTIFRLNCHLLLLTTAFIAAALYWLPPMIEKIRVQRAILASRQNIQLNFEQVLSLYANEYEKRQSKLEKIRPEKDNIVQILDSLEEKAHTIGLKLNFQNLPEKTEPVAEFASLRYRIGFTADKETFLRFLDLLAKLPVYSEIRDLQVEAKAKKAIETEADYVLVTDFFIK